MSFSDTGKTKTFYGVYSAVFMRVCTRKELCQDFDKISAGHQKPPQKALKIMDIKVVRHHLMLTVAALAHNSATVAKNTVYPLETQSPLPASQYEKLLNDDIMMPVAPSVS